ncbi:MAG: GAF domain-containing protein [Anaerolineales bacterium]
MEIRNDLDGKEKITPETGFASELEKLQAENAHLRQMVAQLNASSASLRQRAEHLDSLNRIGRSLSTLRDLRSALLATLDEIRAYVPLDVFFVALCDYETRLITFPLLLDNGEFFDSETWSLDETSWTTEVIHSGQPMLRNNTAEEIAAMAQEQETLFGTKLVPASVVMAPLLVRDTVIGVIALQSYQPNTYNESHLAFIVGASHQVAIAIENARLYEALLSSQESIRRQAEKLEALNRIGRALANLKDLRGAFQVTLEQMMLILPLDTFYIALRAPGTDQVYFPMLYDSGKYYENESRQIVQGTHTERVLRTRQPLLINHTPQEIERQSKVRVGDTSRPSGSIMMAPLQAGDDIIGVVSLQSYTPNTYNEDSLALLVGSSHQIAIAIENARLYEALQQELSERKRAEEEALRLSAEMEQRVKQRTAELEAMNQELESFTYSVSHDLRAPVRGISGLSHILVQDFAGILPDEARAYLMRIEASARQMGNLIDDLLSFSRLGRQSVHRSVVDTDALARDVAERLVEEAPNKNIQLKIGNLPRVYGDPSLLRQVFINLISNAIKFSRKREQPEIEINWMQQGEESVFFVRDNGAGFDMAYAGNLFGVFKRLHHVDEFEGTGVGLAIVQRILQKHGGRIWAEAALDKGATFFFTLQRAD